MMYRARALLFLTPLLTLLAAGCGSSSSAPDAGPLPVDQCLNASDLAIFEALVATTDGGLPDGGVPDGGPYPFSFQAALSPLIEACGRGDCLGAILSEDNAEQCMAACLGSTSAAGLSTECIACQNEAVRCAAAHCVTICLGSDPEACLACGYQYCGARTIECSGLPQIPR